MSNFTKKHLFLVVLLLAVVLSATPALAQDGSSNFFSNFFSGLISFFSGSQQTPPQTQVAAVGAVASQAVRVAVLLINFDSNPVEPVTKEDVNKFYFDQNNPKSLSSYYKEVSYGRMNLIGDIYGYYTLAYSQISPYSGCGYSVDDVNNYIKAINNVDFAKYDGVLLTIVPKAGCSAALPNGLRRIINTTSGNKEIGVVYNFIDVSNLGDKLNGWAIPHEFGHSLGLHHSDYLDCQSTTITDNIFRDCKFLTFRVNVGCSADDPTCSGCSAGDQPCIARYSKGDSFDLMGSDNGGLSVYQREKVGFLLTSQINVVGSSGIYTIEPRETNTFGVKAIKIPLRDHSTDENDKDFYYYIEYVRPIGSDAALSYSGELNGAFIHLVNPKGLLYPRQSDDQAILDMSPHSNNDMNIGENIRDVVLKTGQTFKDDKRRISIKTIDVKDDKLVVEVNYGYTAPPLNTTYTPATVFTDEFLQYDTCGLTRIATRTSYIPAAADPYGHDLNHCVSQGSNDPTVKLVTNSTLTTAACATGWERRSWFTNAQSQVVNLCIKRATVPVGSSVISNAYLRYDSCAAGDVSSGSFLDKAGRKVYHCTKTETVKSVTSGVAYTLATTVSGKGSITVTPQKATYAQDELVTLTAFPESGYQFSTWGGSISGASKSIVIKMDNNKIISATFAPILMSTVISVASSPISGVSINGVGDSGIGAGGTTPYNITGSTDMLTTLEAPTTITGGYVFSSWAGCTSVSGNDCTVSVLKSNTKTVTANYQVAPPVVGPGQPLVTLPHNILSLQYDESQSGALKSDMTININAVGGKVLVPIRAGDAFAVDLINTTDPNHSSYGGAVATKSLTAVSAGLATADCSTQYVTINCYVIPAGLIAQFRLTSTYNTRQMFAGAYTASLVRALLNDTIYYPASYSGDAGVIPANVSNPITIVGETSPYISSVTNPVDINATVTVTGERFAVTGNTVTAVTGATGANFTLDSANGLTLTFVPKDKGITMAGVYNLQVTNPSTGLSNNVSFQVTGTVSTATTTTTTTYTPSLVIFQEFFRAGGCGVATKWETFDSGTGTTIYHCMRTTPYNSGLTAFINSAITYGACQTGWNVVSTTTEPVTGKIINLCAQRATVKVGGSIMTNAYLVFGGNGCAVGDNSTSSFLDKNGQQIGHCVKTEIVTAHTAALPRTSFLAAVMEAIGKLFSR